MEKVFFENSKGQKLCGILEEVNSKKEIVILVHGFASSKDTWSRKLFSKEIGERDINSLAIDLNGCGESEGNFAEHTISQAADDVHHAIEFVKSKGYKEISLVGRSAGGITSMVVALHHPEIKTLVLKCPVSDYPSQIIRKKSFEVIEKWKTNGSINYLLGNGRELTLNYSFFEDAQKYVMHDKVKDIKCPVLIVHGDADVTVLLKDSKKLVNGFPNAQLIIIKGAKHDLTVNGNHFLTNKIFADWLEGKDLTFTEEMELYKG